MTTLNTMNETLLSMLRCPACYGELRPVNFRGNSDGMKGTDAPSSIDEIAAGLLKCAPCGTGYPIVDGVPRLLEGGISSFPEFLVRYKKEITAEGYSLHLGKHGSKQQRRDNFDAIRQSFTEEWGIFDYASDKTWGWTLEDRKRVFLGDLGLTEDQLRGKLLLDAGCGNGSLTATLSTFGLEVVGLDLHDKLGVANGEKVRYAGEHWENVHFVQGNVFNPPLKQGSFDLIYCSGVLHHTPNTKESFRKLVPLVKKGGRLYVWVYGNRGLTFKMLMYSARQLRRFMTLEKLLIACRVAAPFYKAGTGLLNALGLANFRKRTTREITLDLFDAFSPPYAHQHSEEEVQGWFKEMGFTNIAISGRQRHGFGAYGDKL